MVNRNLAIGCKRETVEAVGQHEHALLDIFEFKIGLYQLVAYGILLLLVFLVVVAPVPRHQIAFETLCACILGNRAVILMGVLLGFAQQLVEELVDRLRRLCHAVFEHVVGVALVTQQIGYLQTQLGYSLDVGRIVVLAAQRARVVLAIELLLDVALRRVGHERTVARCLQRYRPALLAASLGLGGHALLDEIGKLLDQCRVGNVVSERVGGVERVLAELKRQLRQLGGILAVKLLVGLRECGAAASEALVRIVEQLAVLGVEFELLVLVYGLDACEQLGVERYVVAQLRQLGRYAHGDILHLVRRIGRQQIEEYARYAAEQLSAALHGHDRILEGRGLGVVYYRLDLGAVYRYCEVERRLVVGQLDLIERRGGVRRVPLLYERILDQRLGHPHTAPFGQLGTGRCKCQCRHDN